MIYQKLFIVEIFDSSYLIKNNDILIAMDGNFKISIWNGGKALLNQRVDAHQIRKWRS